MDLKGLLFLNIGYCQKYTKENHLTSLNTTTIKFKL